VASVGYRLSQHAIMPAQIQDCMAAVRWLKDHAAENGIDPERICAWGASAGGHLVALMGTAADDPVFNMGAKTSSKVNCVVDYFGPFDFTTIMKQSDPKTTQIQHDAPDSPESKLIGGPVLENREKALKASPVSYVTKDDAPTLIVHGTKDLLVPYAQSVDFEAALKKAGVEVSLHTVEGAGHGNGFGDPENKAVVKFIVEHLKP
jgi:acetyl esterase/lipase